jgi:glycine/D-amino acid oxidase-like deaminating enzyme
MGKSIDVEVAIIGAGIAGISAAYYLCEQNGKTSVLLIDKRQPMSYTSAQSGDNYRDWWPHPVMVEFSGFSIDLMEKIRRDTDNVFNMTDRGYVLATRREDIGDLVAGLHADADIVSGRRHIAAAYPALADDIRHVVHIRRAGDISGQQLGSFMLNRVRAAGGRRLAGEVVRIDYDRRFSLDVSTPDGNQRVHAEKLLVAAGPFAGKVSAMLGIELRIRNVFQQKIAFEDVLGSVPRDMPFTIDLDERTIEWTDGELEMLAEDPELEWLVREMPGGTHCRPDGGVNGKWVKLGWAYNSASSEPQEDLANEPRLDPSFAEIVIRRASSLLPSLTPYVEKPPVRRSHYGGYYTMTDENWPLIGPLGPDGAFLVGALSGFGSMAACAAGSICATWMCGGQLPDYARDLSLARYENVELMSAITGEANRGLL